MSAPLLEFSNVRVEFGGVMALAEVSFGVKPGTITALIGPNGAGKTTTINVITGVYRASSGRVVFDGQPVHRLPPHRIAALGLARTFQNIQVFANMNILENVMVGRHTASRAGFVRSMLRIRTRPEEAEIRDEAMRVLELFNLADKARWLSSRLSYGQMKRVEMARALVSNPKLLLLDEPVAGLNASETDDVAELIERIRDSGVSVLLVEHDMSLVMSISDEVVVLNHGHKIAQGAPGLVQQDPGVITAYLGETAG